MGTEFAIEPSTPLIVMLLVLAGVPFCTKKLTVAVPLLFSEDGLKLTLTPDGTLLALSATLPVRPPTNVTVRVADFCVPGATERAVGDIERVKFGRAVTVRGTVVLEVVPPLVPVMVI